MEYKKAERISLKSHPELNEKWVQDRIAEDPSILGLGEVILKDRERLQPHAGRLDLLLQDADTESNRRYEVEIQLGKTDESHVIRTLEYWDIEKKRYPQYDHVAVIVAEDITSRFLNVISLFNGVIPLVAIQMSTLKIGEHITLTFTTVLDQLILGLVEDDEEEHEVVDRAYWQNRNEPSLRIVDGLFTLIHEIDPQMELNYNKYHIGLAKSGRTNNFVVFNPRKGYVRMNVKLDKSEELEQEFEDTGLDLVDYQVRSRRYRFRVKSDEISERADILRKLFSESYDAAMK